ncbi:hypothetical protein ACFOY2_47545 [Nonomuraea purpurea]|uniref:Tyr recombinase domain-containing protein n=1 Tax=Nonomuraea purpurea TaxID=1849276 RepID=A0ABV8GPS5_9ACTN
MVWTPAQTRLFLEEARRHRLFALHQLIALRGLRRGEACGLRWKEVDLNDRTLTVNWQLVQLAWQVHEGTPKTDASVRTIALDTDTAQVLRAHRQQQLQERPAMGEAWNDTGSSSPNPTAAACIPSTSPTNSSGSPTWPDYRPSDCMTSAMARPR